MTTINKSVVLLLGMVLTVVVATAESNVVPEGVTEELSPGRW